MTDIEMTMLCALAIGWDAFIDGDRVLYKKTSYPEFLDYDPLHDDAHAMALVKKFNLGIVFFSDAMWSVNDRHNVSQSSSLNRAICECVAKMQSAKP